MTLLILSVIAWATTSCAARFKHRPAHAVLPQSINSAMFQPPMIHTPVNPPHPQMALTARPDDSIPNDDLPKWRFNADGEVVPIQRWTLGNVRQTWPPGIFEGIEAKRILSNWAELLVEGHNETVLAGSPSGTTGHQQEDKSLVLHTMRYDVAENEVGFLRSDLEMVGLIEKDLEIQSGRSRSSAVSASVQALGMFSRVTLMDDRRGSLRKKVEAQYGKRWARRWWGRAKKQFAVFEVGGIINAPDLPERSARALLSKIYEYASQERRIVVVSRNAYFSDFGAYDLTDYYVHLGFEKVDMEDGSYTLVYTGTSPSAEEMWVENRQVMIGLKLWPKTLPFPNPAVAG